MMSNNGKLRYKVYWHDLTFILIVKFALILVNLAIVTFSLIHKSGKYKLALNIIFISDLNAYSIA